MSNLLSLSFAVSVPLCATHGFMNKPPSWHDPTGYWVYDAGQCAPGCKGENATRPSEGCACEYYSNYTFVTAPTIPPFSPLKTYMDACQQGGPGSVDSCCQDYCQDPVNQMEGGACVGCDWTRLMPWRAPGSAPVFSPCGFDGGNPEGCPVGNADWEGCNGGGYGHGPDGRSLPGNDQPAVWHAGTVEEVAWGVTANHGGGYQYRLCPKQANPMDLTEECFQQTPLRFSGNTQWLQNGTDNTTRREIPAMRTVTGTTPKGSQWTKVPIPACGGTGGGSGGPHAKDCEGLGTQFPPPFEGAMGFGFIVWNIIDNVHVPNLPTGDYVLSFRYDCEQTSQVWNQCGDVTIVMPPPSPPTPPPSDNCDNPACASCCTGSCSGCKGYCENVKDGDCSNCWNDAPGSPPCNLEGTKCLADDHLHCTACWSTDPLPAFFSPHPRKMANHAVTVATPVTPMANYTDGPCRTDLAACDSCCTGSCGGCRGYCEDHLEEEACAGCRTPSEGAPPCNGRGCQCMHADGLGCELCWQAAPPAPTPKPTPTPPAPSPPVPSPEGCPGGSFAGCIEACPSGPFDDFEDCLHECQRRCDPASLLVRNPMSLI